MKGLMAAALLLVVAAALGVAAAGGKPKPRHDLQAAKAATARYHSFQQALKHGYTIVGEACIVSPGRPGSGAPAMGIHAINPALMADPAIDVRRPEMLLYIPGKHGKLRLVGLEYWKADADQNLGTSTDKPSLFGQPFVGPMPGHGPPGAMPIHYDLHVWLWEANPAGMFAEFNPNIACP